MFGCFAALGVTLLFGTITVSGAKKYCVQIDEESLAIIFGNKVKRVEFKDIVCWGENGESILILKVTYLSLLSYFRWMIFQRKYFHTILNMVTFLLL